MDAVRQAEQLETIKEHINPSYTREEAPAVPDAEVIAVAGLLGVEKPSVADRDKLAFIKHQFDAENDTDLLYQIRSMERRLTPPRLGERRLDLLYNYLRARQTATRAQQLMDTYEDGPR